MLEKIESVTVAALLVLTAIKMPAFAQSQADPLAGPKRMPLNMIMGNRGSFGRPFLSNPVNAPLVLPYSNIPIFANTRSDGYEAERHAFDDYKVIGLPAQNHELVVSASVISLKQHWLAKQQEADNYAAAAFKSDYSGKIVKLAMAINCYVFASQEAMHGNLRQEAATSLNKAGNCALALGEVDEARKLHQQASELTQTGSGGTDENY